MVKLGLLKRIIGDSNEKEIKRLQIMVDGISALADEYAALSDEELRGVTEELKARLSAGETMEDILEDAFAAVREMAWRIVGEKPYDVQMMGGIVLHEGKIAEMKTGEGKTLTSIAPVFLNAVTGRGVHLVTVNDYLARRDAAWYGPVYQALGLTIGVIQNNGAAFMYEPGYEPEDGDGGMEDLRPTDRQSVYRADITYGTNNEYGFDYLRDNMVRELDRKVQRPLAYALVDEVDNILIDEARTPLIISGGAEEASSTYQSFARAVKGLRDESDYVVDHKAKHVALTETGITRVERALGVANIFGEDASLARHLEASLDAEYLKRDDRDYVIRDGEIVIVDEFTGRMMPGRRWSHGIHQAVEAKEGVKIQRESITHATITFQNYFRLYEKLSGMTGTAETEAEEFAKIYNLEVVGIPTNREMIRDDHQDIVFLNEKAKFNAVVGEIEEMQVAGRPVLVGTTSIEKSEYLASLLTRKGITHEVLNAKQHEREAHIIEAAGAAKAVTIATNMAGRGTDIKLGDGVAGDGGLHVIGTERHESRRIDNQLRGRAGRQGDPGSSRFFVSFGDDIMKRFAPEWVPGMMQKMGLTEDMPLESKMVTRAIAQSQVKVEGHNFDIRKRLVEFDDVNNEQRSIIYSERDMVLERAKMAAAAAAAEAEGGEPAAQPDDDDEEAAKDNRQAVLNMLVDELDSIVDRALDESDPDFELLHTELAEILVGTDVPSADELADMGEGLADNIVDRAEARYEEMEEMVGADNMRRVEDWILLETIDYHWRQHLTAVEELRQSIGLQAYAQIDPLVAFKREGFDMFLQLQDNIRAQVAKTVFRVKVKDQLSAGAAQKGTAPDPAKLQTGRGDDEIVERPVTAAVKVQGKKLGRNEPCHCGSGKKYKKCHGKVA